MSQIPLSNPSQAAMRENIVKYLIKGGWFFSKENIVRFIDALLGTPLSTSLVEPVNHLFDLSELDYGTMLKISLAHWMRKDNDMATLTNLYDILRTAGFCEPTFDELREVGGVIMTPINGVELQECCENCQPGDTIILKSNTEYYGQFRLANNQVTLRGADGSNIVGMGDANFWVLYLSGDDCVVDNVRCTGSNHSVFVSGNRSNITGLVLNCQGISVYGDDNNVHNVVIYGVPYHCCVYVQGERNYFENLKTQHGSEGAILISTSAKKYVFQNCSFEAAGTSTIEGRSGRFVDVNFPHGVLVDAEDIMLERCSGTLLELTAKAKVEQRYCNFLNVKTKEP